MRDVRPTTSRIPAYGHYPDKLRKEECIKTILHLCADLGSDSKYYQLDQEYNVIMVGEKIGVENYTPPENVIVCPVTQ